MEDKMKTLHIIPHTHWDREWYMPFEKHRIRLVQLMDDLIDLLEARPEYPTYHLDGQYIVIQDYLEVRPERKERLMKLIQEKRIHIGPWYVLQDEYLTSGEANIRNLLLGIQLSSKLGEPIKVGYFPDSFGNISQAPQILQGFDIKTAVFGRGLNSLGPNNQIVKQNGINESELIWKSPDGSEVFAILFANWYHNAMELPIEEVALKKRLEEIVEKTEQFATTNQLLGMNGCDHQPIQKNLPDVIKEAQNLLPDVLVTFSDFPKYIEHVKEQNPVLKTHIGEITGQYTNGWYLLISTASTRIYTKQLNQKAQSILQYHAEPLASIYHMMYSVDLRHLLKHNWLKLMENHPHDTICGCSNDRTHEDMVTMLKRSIDISEGIIDTSWNAMTELSGEKKLILFNPLATKVNQLVKIEVDFPLEQEVSQFYVKDRSGRALITNITHIGETFTYSLPDDSFRKASYVNRYVVEVVADLKEGYGFEEYRIAYGKQVESSAFLFDGKHLESDTVKLTFHENGTFDLWDKKLKVMQKNNNLYEDAGDIGNEYEFVEAKDNKRITSGNGSSSISLVQNDKLKATVLVKNLLQLPAKREGNKRTNLTKPFLIETTYTVYHHTRRVDISVAMDNQIEDHRVRALFDMHEPLDFIEAEGQFDLVKRQTVPWEGWENPSNLQRFESMLIAKNSSHGMIIASRGIHEYEVLLEKRNLVGLTLLRSIGELGDWGVFKTPDAQCKGMQYAQYSIELFVDDVSYEESLSNGYSYVHQPVLGMYKAFKKDINPYQGLISLDGKQVFQSAIKSHETKQNIIFRFYSLYDQKQNVSIRLGKCFKKAYMSNLSEERKYALPIKDGEIILPCKAKEIITIELEY